MEYYNLCSKVIEKELKKFNLDRKAHSEFESGLTALFPDNFDVPYNRCAFMSCYATTNVLTFKDCINNFLLGYPKAQDLLSEWKSHSEVKVCSLSTGPGLDYLAFVLAILAYDPLPPKFNGAKVVSKYTSWQNTIDLISEVFQEQGSVLGISLAKLNFNNVKVIQTDDLIKGFSTLNEHGPLRDAHIILMMKTLSLSASGLPQELSVLQMLKELLSSLRSDATIFCFDTIPSITIFTQALSCFPGQMLYGPTQQTSPILPTHSESPESQTLVRTSGTFFVWRKLPFSLEPEPFSFEAATIRTNHKLVTASKGTKNFFVSESFVDKPEEKVTFSEILPWRELPPGKLSWGAIFWENASSKSKKSLKCLMALKKESLEFHWIGEVARLYLKEYGTQSFSTSPSENIDAEKNSGESTLKAEQVVVEDTEILFNAQTLETSQNVSCSKDITENTENKFTEKKLSGNVMEEKASVEIVATESVIEIFKELTIPETPTTSIQTKIEALTKESNRTAKLAFVVNNNIKEGSQFNDNNLFETDAQGSFQMKNNLTATRISDVSALPCLKSQSKIKKQKEPLKYSEILPWRELPPGKIPWGTIFWQNASTKTRKSLKSVLSFKKDILDCHWIGEVAELYIKEYGTQNISTLSLPKEVRNKSASNENVEGSAHNVTEAFNILSIPKTKLTSLSIQTPENQLNTNTENVLFQKDNCFDIEPSSFHMEVSNFNCKSMHNDFTAQTSSGVFQSLEAKNIPYKPLPLQSKENIVETQVKHHAQQNEISKITEFAVNNNTDKSFKTKFSQTTVIPNVNHTKNNLASIAALTDSVRQLVTSFERLTNQNNPNTMNENNYNDAHQKRNALCSNYNTCRKGESVSSGHSITKHSSASRNIASFKNKDTHAKSPHQCDSFHSRPQCCHSRLNNTTQLNSCSMHCHCHDCNKPRYQFSPCGQLTCSETSQNLVIPIRNISDDALLKIVSILKRE